jgi:four helix bundle protein
MRNAELQSRTKRLALAIIRLIERLPKNRVTDVMSKQLVRCGTSVGANYRSACRAKSRADFIAKMGTVEEEADETGYWLELLFESQFLSRSDVQLLFEEIDIILRMTVASIRTARNHK